jgi:hypothetical protein
MPIHDLLVCWPCAPALLNCGEWHMIQGMAGAYNCPVLGGGYNKIGGSQTEQESCYAEDLGTTGTPTVGRLVSQ